MNLTEGLFLESCETLHCFIKVSRIHGTKIPILVKQILITELAFLLLGAPKTLCPVCVATVEELYIQLSRFLHSYLVQAST